MTRRLWCEVHNSFAVSHFNRFSYVLSAELSDNVIEPDDVMIGCVSTAAVKTVKRYMWCEHSSATNFNWLLSVSFDAHCCYCYVGTAIKRPVLSDRVKLWFIIFDIRALWRSGLGVRVPGCKKINGGLARSGTKCFICVSMATVGVTGLTVSVQ